MQVEPPAVLMNTILNVDDNAASRYARSRVLRQAGYMVLEATTGEEAIAIVNESRPALVLLDVNLPDISGLDVCRKSKQSRKRRPLRCCIFRPPPWRTRT